MGSITDLGLNVNELEKKVEATLRMYPGDIVELTDLSELAYDTLKKDFSGNYEVRGIINVLSSGDKRTNYILHIRKQNA